MDRYFCFILIWGFFGGPPLSPSGFYLSERRKQAGAFLDSVNVKVIHMNVDC